MKIKFKLTTKNIFSGLYIALIVSNLAVIIIMARFADKYVFRTITIDRSSLVSEKKSLTGDVDMEKFDKTYSKLLNKKIKNDTSAIKNIFD